MTPNAYYLLNPVLSASSFTPVSDMIGRSIIFILQKTTLEGGETPKAKQKLFLPSLYHSTFFWSSHTHYHLES